MQLPVWRQLPYISYSTLSKWLSCEYKVYLSRLAGFPYVPDKQSLAAAIGNVFDSFIKDYIAKKRNIKGPALEINNLLNKNVQEQNRQEAIPIGKDITKLYIQLGLADEFITTKEDIYIDMELYGTQNNIPLLGITDLICKNIPVDWKTGGFTGNRRYPTKGFCRRIDYDLEKQRIVLDFPDKDILKLYTEETQKLLLEQRNESWAMQMAIYNMLLKNNLSEERQFIIHEIVKHNNIISFAIHKGFIGLNFIKQLNQLLESVWLAITDKMYTAEINEPMPTTQRCEPFGYVCEVAHICKFYEGTLGNPDKRKYYVQH